MSHWNNVNVLLPKHGVTVVGLVKDGTDIFPAFVVYDSIKKVWKCEKEPVNVIKWFYLPPFT